MIVHIAPDDLEQFARAWLKCALDILNSNAADERAHPDDLKTYKKDIKAVKRVLDYMGQ